MLIYNLFVIFLIKYNIHLSIMYPVTFSTHVYYSEFKKINIEGKTELNLKNN